MSKVSSEMLASPLTLEVIMYGYIGHTSRGCCKSRSVVFFFLGKPGLLGHSDSKCIQCAKNRSISFERGLLCMLVAVVVWLIRKIFLD